MKILLIEDSRRLREALGHGLRRLGYTLVTAADGEEGYRLASTQPFDIIILDLMLPKLDGLSVLRKLRAEKCDTNILILSARDTVEQRVEGLRSGADDYLVKPFSFEELVARIQALTRRRFGTRSPRIVVGPLTVDTAGRVAYVDGEPVALTAREFAILEYLAFHRDRVVSRAQIEEALYEDRFGLASNAVESAICLLRKKIDRPGRPSLIQTRRGLGYVLTDALESGGDSEP
ncbi:MAG: response regulator transcription factor [Candidatus Sumerlaeaceae bacterium]|jgi:DNA-binding response OmpR family regulator